MNGKLNRMLRKAAYCCMAVLVVASVLLSPALANPAHAAGYGYYWKLEFDFEGGLNGRLTVDAGPGVVGALDKVLVTRQFRVPCQSVGNVTAAGGVATFNGGYLQCRLDLAAAINATFAQCATIDPACTYALGANEVYPSLRMRAQMRSSQIGAAPIFYHPDATFAAQVLDPNALVLHNQINPVGSIDSPVISIPGLLGSWQNYVARYICLGAPPCTMTYSAGGSTWPVGPFGGLPVMQTAPVTVYVGYDPIGGSALPAPTQLDNLFVDPPNLGNH